jgi:hypothetical protein
MALLGTITKQPREQIDFDLSYTKVLLNRSDSILSVTTEVTASGQLIIDFAQIRGSTVKIKIAEGVSGQSYKITVIATTKNGYVYEDEVIVNIEEV